MWCRAGWWSRRASGATIELGEGIRAMCRVTAAVAVTENGEWRGGGFVGADVDAAGSLEEWRGAGWEPAGAAQRGADSELPDREARSRGGED